MNLLHQAFALHQAGQLTEAAALYRQVLVLAPDQPDALHLLGVVERRNNNVVYGITLIRRALVCDPGLVDAYHNLGNMFHGLGRLEEAEPILRQLLHLKPDHMGGLNLLGHLLLQDGRPAAAEPVLAGISDDGDRVRQRFALERSRHYQTLAVTAADPALPPGLIVRGPFRDNSGYAYKVRQFVRHLVAAGVRVQLVDLHYKPEQPETSAGPLEPLFETLDRPVRARAVLSFTTPPMVEAIPGLKTINYSVIETTTIPSSWGPHSRRHDAVIVATPSSREAWIAGGCPADRLHICPEGVEAVDESVWDQSGLRAGLFGYRTRFVNISDVNPRKNLGGVFRVWLRATRAGDDAVLVIKAGKNPQTRDDVRRSLVRAVEVTGIVPQAAAPMFLITDRLSDPEMLALLAVGTHYLSLSHGEGWDLPLTQAGALGLTLIAPRHSAYTAYLDDRIAHLLPCTVVEADPSYPGMSWWQPDEDAAVRVVAGIIRAPDAGRRSAKERLLSEFTWDQAARRLITILETLGAL